MNRSTHTNCTIDQMSEAVRKAVDEAVSKAVPSAVQVSIPIYVNGKIDKLTTKLDEYMDEQSKLNQARFKILTRMDNEQQILKTNQAWLMRFMIAVATGIGGMFVTLVLRGL